MDLSKHITEVMHEWLTNDSAWSAQEINSGGARGGNCADFAKDVLARLAKTPYAEKVWDVDLANFQAPEEGVEEGRPLDRSLLAEHWPAVKPTQGLTWKDLDRLSQDAGWSSGIHVWLVHGDRHYDAECPQGTENFLELPFFERVISEWKRACQAQPTSGRRLGL